MYVVRVEFWDGYWTEVVFSSDIEQSFDNLIQRHGAIIQLKFTHIRLY